MLHTDDHSSHATHGSKGTYNLIFIVLAIITVGELLVAEALGGGEIRATLLLALTTFKAGLVAAYYMHLKYDPPALTWIFVVPMLFGAAIIISLQGLAG